MRRAVAFTGPSNSGKTTIIQKVASILLNDYKVAIIKNDPKDKARFDVEGKDSFKFFQTGAEVAVVSPHRTTYFSHKSQTLDEMIAVFGDFDFLLVEGLKTLPLPRISIFRNKIDEAYYGYCDAIAVDDTIDTDKANIPDGIAVLDLNDPEAVIEWIKHHAKKV
jgi:molybdopterin-guanine dinucleotide biosynthesis protein B